MQVKLKIKEILKSDILTDRAGLNPWCVAEGLADGDEWCEVELENVDGHDLDRLLRENKE